MVLSRSFPLRLGSILIPILQMRRVKTKMTTLTEVTQGRSGTARTRTQADRSEPWLFTTWGQGLRAGREGARWERCCTGGGTRWVRPGGQMRSWGLKHGLRLYTESVGSLGGRGVGRGGVGGM